MDHNQHLISSENIAALNRKKKRKKKENQQWPTWKRVLSQAKRW